MSYQRHTIDSVRAVRREAARERREPRERFLEYNPVTGAHYCIERFGGPGSGDWRTVGGPVTREQGERWRERR